MEHFIQHGKAVTVDYEVYNHSNNQSMNQQMGG